MSTLTPTEPQDPCVAAPSFCEDHPLIVDDPEGDDHIIIEPVGLNHDTMQVPDPKTLTVDKMAQDYKTRLEEYRAYFLSRTNEQHALLFQACETGDISDEFVNDKLNTIRKFSGDSDFAMQPLIRVLYQNISDFPPDKRSKWQRILGDIVNTLAIFPFWPVEGGDPMNSIVFWSENHLFMTLSAAYLFHQKCSTRPDWERDHRECQYLRAYIDLHLHRSFNGVFEVNSHVYLPFTLTALMNLYDFALDEELRAKSKRLIDRIVELLMLGTDPFEGVANLSASARAFLRTRVRNHGHNINILLYLLLGKAPNTHEGASMLSHILLTTWEPDMTQIHQALYFKGFQKIQVSPPIGTLLKILGPGNFDPTLPDLEFTPFLWSAGLVTHPQFLERSHAYISKYNLTHNTHLWPMQFLLQDFSQGYRIFSMGQAYTNILLNIYKDPEVGLLMTSFEQFSPSRASFQQVPFMINMAGVPIWAQSGAGSESMAGFSVTNTHNPIIEQKDDIMVLSYLAPRVLTSSLIVGTMFSYRVRFFWPSNEFLDYAYLVVYGKSYGESLPILYEPYDQRRTRRKNASMPIVNYVVNSLPKMKLPKGVFFGKKNMKKHKATINNVIETVSTASAAATVIAEGGAPEDVVDVLRRRFEKRHRKRLQKRLQQSNSTNQDPVLPCEGTNFNEAEENRIDSEEDTLLQEWEDALLRQNEAQRLWKIAEREKVFVALLCTKNISCVERHSSKDADLNPFRNGPTATSVRLVCDAARHSWIVVVGSKHEYPSIVEFVDNKLRHIRFSENDSTSTGEYTLVVDDASTSSHRNFHISQKF